MLPSVQLPGGRANVEQQHLWVAIDQPTAIDHTEAPLGHLVQGVLEVCGFRLEHFHFQADAVLHVGALKFGIFKKIIIKKFNFLFIKNFPKFETKIKFFLILKIFLILRKTIKNSFY